MIAISTTAAPELPAPADGTCAAPAAEPAGEGRPAAFARLLDLALDAAGTPARGAKNPDRNDAADSADAAAETVATPAQADATAPLAPAIALQPPAASPAATPNAAPQGKAVAALALASAHVPEVRGRSAEALASAPGMVAKEAPAEPAAMAALPAGNAASDAQAANASLPQAGLAAPAAELQNGADAVSAAPPAHAAPVHPHADIAPAPLRVAALVQAPEFPREFATQVHIAVQHGLEQASIQVHPPELGPVDVRLEIGNGEARLHFAAENAATREAIADALPKLRELLGAQGLTLAGTSVGAEMPGREQADSQRQPSAATGAERAAGAVAAEAAHAVRSTLRLVDVFA